MRWKFIIAFFTIVQIVGCKTPEKITPAAEQEVNVPKKPEPEAEKTIQYHINEDYVIDEEYPRRIQKEGISSIVFHYTAQTYKKSLRSLTQGENSSHWLIPATGDTVYKIVNEDRRARHAGPSLWKNRKNLNVISVGIEIVNLGFKCKKRKKMCTRENMDWYDYPEDQQKMIIALAKDIKDRYNIDPLCVIGHSDIAVDRKVDPGPFFPWKRLADNGIGAWATDEEIQKEVNNIQKNIKGNISKLLVQLRLYEYGYDLKKDRTTNKGIHKKLLKFNYSIQKTPLDDLKALNSLNTYGNKNLENNIFDEKKTKFAIESFMMHYLPKLYLEIENSDRFIVNTSKESNEDPDNKPDQLDTNKANYDSNHLIVFATIQALLTKYPEKARSGCGF